MHFAPAIPPDLPRAAMTTANSEARRAQRKPLRTLGEIECLGRDAGIECTVLDLSTTGAKLKVAGVTRRAFAPSLELPETFRLLIPRDNIAMDCRLAWREGDTIGVSFTSGFRPIRKRP